MQQNPLAGLAGVDKTAESPGDPSGDSVTVANKEELLVRKAETVAPSDSGDPVPFRGENNLDYWIALTQNG